MVIEMPSYQRRRYPSLLLKGSKTPMYSIFWATDSFLERDLEDPILRELETFLLHRSFPLALTSI
jgi:hypothetical protein